MDEGLRIVETAVRGLKEVQNQNSNLPSGSDRSVLLAWRDLGGIFYKGCTRITFTVNHRPMRLNTEYTPEGFEQVQRRIIGPETNLRTIEGRLLMADFREHGLRCRIRPPVGDAVICVFTEDQKEQVLENILHYVRIVGEAEEDPASGKISAITIHDIQSLAKDQEEDAGFYDIQAHSHDFWHSPSLEDLAEQQGVKPVTDLSALIGTWPGDVDDDFEKLIEALRHRNRAGEREQ